jgi:hypothetical protein
MFFDSAKRVEILFSFVRFYSERKKNRRKNSEFRSHAGGQRPREQK